MAGVHFSCVSRVSPVSTNGVWTVRIPPPQSPFLSYVKIKKIEKLWQACHSPASLLPIALQHVACGDTKSPPQSSSVHLYRLRVIIPNKRYLAGVPLPAFLLTQRVRSSTISTSNTPYCLVYFYYTMTIPVCKEDDFFELVSASFFPVSDRKS